MADQLSYRVTADEANLLNLMQEAVYLIDSEQNLLFLNRQVEQRLGFSNSDVAGRKCFELFGRGGCCRDRCPVARIIHSPHRNVKHQVTLQPKEGPPQTFLFDAQPFVKEGVILGTLIFLHNSSPDRHSNPLASQDGGPDQERIRETIHGAGLRDIFNLADLERMVSVFAEIHGITSAIFDDRMEMVTDVYNFSDSCLMVRSRKEGLARCLQSDERLLHSALENRPSTLRCMSAGLMDAVAPIVIEGKRLGTWALGQVMVDGEFDEKCFRAFAEEIGLVPDAYLAALEKQTRMPMAKMEKLAEFLVLLTKMLGQVGLNHLVLNRLHEQLQREKELLAVTLRSIGDGIVTLDAQGKVLLLNSIAEKMTGWPSEEAIGRGVEEVVHLVHPHDKGQRIMPQNIAELFYDQAQLNSLCPLLIARSGREYSVVPSLSEISHLNGEKGGQVLVLHDITELKQLQENLLQSQKMEAIGTLAGGIAHDFNNMLNAILGYAQLSLRAHDLPNALRENLQQIVRAGTRAANLVQQILTFSRKNEQQRKVLFLQPLIKESLAFLRSTLPANIVVRQNVDGQCGAVLANPTQIHQVIMNLCANARYAMLDNGGILGIELEEATLDGASANAVAGLQAGRYARLTVRDNGQGMDSLTQARIFEPYFTTKPIGQGTGLGLSTVHGIVKANLGAITVQSSPGQGTEFTIYFPIAQGTERAELTEKIADAFHKVGGKVLLVDDEEMLVQLAISELTALGCEVSAFTDSEMALAAFVAAPGKFDALITDQTMPKLSGTQLAAKVLAMSPDLPVILTTGFSETVDAEKAKAMGIREFLEKPVSLTDFCQALSRVLPPRC